MLPIGPLMIEHRVIERMIPPIRAEIDRIERTRQVDVRFALRLADFIQTFADRCHHGKEEKILFAEMEKKDLTPELAKTIDELIADHRRGRELTARVNQSVDAALAGRADAAADGMLEALRGLERLYPPHIDKEDNHCFKPLMEYLSDDEKADMLRRMEEVEATLLHEKYEEVMDGLESAHG